MNGQQRANGNASLPGRIDIVKRWYFQVFKTTQPKDVWRTQGEEK